MKVLVLLVTFLFVLDYFCAWAVLIIPEYTYWLTTPLGIFQTGLQALIFFMAMFSYFKVVSTPPGQTPNGWMPLGFTEEELEEAKLIAESKENNRARNLEIDKPRYCNRCEAFKPQRSYHCSRCKGCTLRMDHHCPWINNCVGNNNHKLFVVFLFWGTTGICYTIAGLVAKVLLMIYSIFVCFFQGEPNYISIMQGVIIALHLVIFCPLVLGMISLFFWQIGISTQNITTIEASLRRKAKREAKIRGEKYSWPYNLGPARNMISFYGPEVALWPLPVQPVTLTDGLRFTPRESQFKPEYTPEDEIINV